MSINTKRGFTLIELLV
ncbi:hypothetical protein DF186_22100, partial [Enterococcus hirae]